MSRSDPLLMLADIARLASENPDLDEALVRASTSTRSSRPAASRRSARRVSTSAT